MPYRDRTGPIGLGLMAGRRAGYSAGWSVPGFMNPVPGIGSWGIGCRWFVRGRGFRHWYYATGLPGWMRAKMGLYPFYGQEITPEREAEILKEQAKVIQEELKSIQERIGILEKTAQKKE